MWETFLFYFVPQIEKTTQLVGSGYMVILHGSFFFFFFFLTSQTKSRIKTAQTIW